MKKMNLLLCVFLISILMTNFQGFCQFDTAFYLEKVERWDTNGYIKFYPDEIFVGEMFTLYKENFLSDTSNEMKIVDTTYDADLNMYAFNYRQYFSNIPVEGSHLTELVTDGYVKYASMVLCPGTIGIVNVESLKTQSAALDDIMNYYSGREFTWMDTSWENSLKRDFNNDSATYYPTGKLIWALEYYPNMGWIIDSNKYTLCYKFEIYLINPFEYYTCYVNAYDGSMLKIDESTDFFYGTAETYDYGTQDMDIKLKSDGNYYLISNEDDRNIETRYYSDKWADCTVLTNDDPDWGTADQLATSAHIYTCKAWDYFKNIHDRNGLNDRGKELRVLVNYQQGTGASFNHERYFGLGAWGLLYHDYIKVGFDPGNNARRVCIDVIGHEFMEGIIDYTVKLENKGEAIAVKQSICDIFGFLVEGYMQNWQDLDWTLGEDGITRRIMDNPYSMNFPKKWHDKSVEGQWQYETSTMSSNDWNDYGHINSVPMSYWFYLISKPGGRWENPPLNTKWIEGIGYDNAAELVYKVVKMKHIPPSVNYWQMWNATRDFAEEMWGKCSALNNNYHNVMQAWSYIDVQLGSGCSKASINTDDVNENPSVMYNPQYNTLTILCNDPVLSLNIYDLNGKMLKQKTDDITNTDLSEILNGIYIVSIKTEKNVFNSKIIVLR